ncbi:ankyrin repeat domain-containing protein 9 [Callorhinchus milii]|uniref:ankyrin repeat domain-containing protein 9 n=1 Tax=Callorhinchus milii TaxID=7868 RepID=UPI001C3FD995|nr:ankyrin repeat domain-containing protein 9 [Callorhinchus milii]
MPRDLHSRDYYSQKRCKKSSFAFYLAVRELLPVWLLEDMRRMEVFHWEESGRVSAYSASEALLYALVHDHRPYGAHLLTADPRAALAAPGDSFGCCRASAPHLAMAVRYNRVAILRGILHTLRGFPAGERRRYLNRTGCARVEGGKTPVHVACELGRAECLALLLAHGSAPDIADSHGNTPLDTLLCRLSHSPPHSNSPQVCLDNLLLFTPVLRFRLQPVLRAEVTPWRVLLGDRTFDWLTGRTPPPLSVTAMQTAIGCISPEKLPEGLRELPVPQRLQPLDTSLCT